MIILKTIIYAIFAMVVCVGIMMLLGGLLSARIGITD